MRVADHYNLNQEQPALNFVNVDTTNDIKAFIDPRALRLLPSDWGNACVSVIQNYFRKLLSEIKNNPDGAKKLLRVLHEPNEIHLGYSKSKSQGKALGTEKADLVWEALTSSETVARGFSRVTNRYNPLF